MKGRVRVWVVDASVYVASVSGADRHHQRAYSWFQARAEAGEALFAPNLLVVELGAAMRRLTGKRRAAERAVSELLEDGLVELVALDAQRAPRAARLAAGAGVRGADAVYLALAQELGATLVTLDRQLLSRGAPVASVRRP